MFNEYRVSVLQDGKVSELCFATTQMQPALLNCTLKTGEDGYDLWFVSFLMRARAHTHTRKVSTESHMYPLDPILQCCCHTQAIGTKKRITHKTEFTRN